MSQSQFSDLAPNQKKALAGSIVSLNFLATILFAILKTKDIPESLGTPDLDEIIEIAGSHFSDELRAGLSIDQLVKSLDRQISEVKPGQAKVITISGQPKNPDNN